jgi:hypothetical protein
VLYLDVPKIDRHVGHVAMLFQVYVSNVSSVLDVCSKCFILIVQSRYDVEHVVVGPTCRSHLIVVAGPCMRVGARGHER